MAAWTDDAACRGMDVSNFISYSVVGEMLYDFAPSAQARLACQMCPVRSQCLEWALELEQEGFCAGMTKPERDTLAASRE